MMAIWREDDGRWACEITDLPGCMAYGRSHAAAGRRCLRLARAICRERRIHGEDVPDIIELAVDPYETLWDRVCVFFIRLGL